MRSKKKKYIFHPVVIKEYEDNPDLLRIHLTSDYTKVDFGYVAKDIYDNGGWIRIAPETFIENTVTKERYTLVNAENIPLAPIHHYFETKKDWRYFSLYFPSIPIKNSVINIIEVENGTPNFFNYYNIDIKMENAIEIL